MGEWETYDESLSVIAADDPVSCAIYTCDKTSLTYPIGEDLEP